MLKTTAWLHLQISTITFVSLALFSSIVTAKPLTIGGFSETVIIVSDLKASSEFYKDIGGWVSIDESPVDDKLKQLWRLPTSAKASQVLMANKGATTGFIRLVKLDGVEQQRIRSNTQSWDVGGIFDINMRVIDMEKKFAQLQNLGWTSATDPVQFSFGPFEVKEWIVKNADGVAFALIERIKPTLKGWPDAIEFSRVFNSTQVVNDIDKSLDFYQNILGFKTYLKHRGASKEEGVNVLGLPYNLTTKIERSVYILHPEGKNEGSVELLQFHGATGKNVSHLAQPPNIGIATLRFPVSDLNALNTLLQNNSIKVESREKMHLLPYGLVDILGIKSPDNTWLEFYQKL
jgi:catechol 2,3-dioxygenase-like lactoylglutathione lyase family enzyme